MNDGSDDGRPGVTSRRKPGNIMLTKSGVKLPDFGLAKSIAPVTPQSGAVDVSDLGRNISEI